jgi:Flp pilus assembly protein CpaB
VLLGVAVASGLVALRPPAPPAVRVTVAAHDLLPGDLLDAADLRTAAVPRAVAPTGALPTAALLGRTVAAVVLAGEPVPAVRLLGAGLGAAAGGPNRVAVPVRLPDDLAALLRVGEVADLVAPSATDVADASSGRADGGAVPTARVIARSARVLASASAGTRSDGLLSGPAGSQRLLVLAVAEDEAASVVAASAQGLLWPVLRAAPPPS